MDALLPFFQLLYFVAHFLYSLCQAFYDTLCDTWRITLQVARWCFPSKFSGLVGLSKLPSHLAVVLLPGQTNCLPELAFLLATLARMGVKYFTTYDAAGKVLQQQEELRRCLEMALPSAKIRLVSSIEDRTSKGPQIQLACNSEYDQLPNGELQQSTNEILSSENPQSDSVVRGSHCIDADCYQSFDAVVGVASFDSSCQQLLASVRRTTAAYGTKSRLCLTSPLLQQQLEAGCQCTPLPEPDLVLVVGQYLSSNGFPPWFLRLSEFVRTQAIHKIDTTELNRILRSYAKVEQRYGR